MGSERVSVDRPANRAGNIRPGDERRYQVTGDGSAKWQVLDSITGLPAATNGRDLVQLDKRDAEDLADELNDCEGKGRPSPLL